MNSMILGGCIPSPKKQTEPITVEKNPNMMYMLVGSYATPDEEGIKVYNFDEQTGNSQYISGIKGISNPSFLIPSADGKRIYTVGEDAGKSSTANAIKFDKEQKKLTLLNSQPTDGGAPCYITLSPSEKFVLTANYMGGSITVFPLDKDGKLKSETRLISFTGNSLDKERQTQPHLHCIKFTPDHKYLLASDLGTDQIHVFPVSENVTDGVSHSLLNESEEFNIKVESGSGPRHICFHPNQKFAYLINEISGKVIAFSYDKEKYGTPYVIGTPYKEYAERISEALEKRIQIPAIEDRRRENLQGTGNSEKIITLIGEPVTIGSLAAIIERRYHYKTRILCPLENAEGLLGEHDLKICGEEEMENALKNAQIVVADPLYRPICPVECEFYERAHIAFSGRMFLKNK